MPEPAEIRTARRALQRLMTERGRQLERGRHAGRIDKEAVSGLDERIRGVLEELHRRRGAVDAAPEAPLVLLPVRLETRFGTRDGGTVLRVRVYPDDVHVDGLERGLTEKEYAAGRAWWGAAWADGDTAQQARADAFAVLVTHVGPDRAGWVAHATTPLNLAQRPAAAPDYPDRRPPLGRGAVARALPDQFVAVAVQGGSISRGVGRPIPPDLAVSPVPTVDGPAPDPGDGSSVGVAAGSEWLVDYEHALEVGMALEVPLQAGAARVDRLVVLGTRSAATGVEGAAELEDLLVGHRFGAGLGLLAQGTPTNNADADRSPYKPRREPVAPPVTPPVAAAGSDASALAQVLGVDAALVTGLVGEGTGEQALAGHVNTALWGAGWGTYLQLLDDRDVPGVSATSRDRARRLFGAHVRGRGPAPALRVGPQPYGVLPVSDLRAWTPSPGEAGSGVAAVVTTLLDQWLWSARRVPLVRPGQADATDLLLEVLGCNPVMEYLRVRPELDEDAAPSVGAATGAQQRLYEWERWLTAAVAAPLLGVDAARLSLGSLDQDDRPLPLPLVSERDDEFVTALLATPSRVLEVDSVLQALLYLSWRHAEEEVEKVSPVHVIPELLAAGQLDRRLEQEVSSVVRRVESVEPAVLFALADRVADAGQRESVAARLSTFQPVEAVSTSLADVALSAAQGREAEVMATVVVGEWLQLAAYRGELRAALGGLLGSDLRARRLAVAEALDLGSHRLDAWATAVVTERRSRQVGVGQARGLTLGAYGVVEELDPDTGGGPHGWIQAPSPEHAVAAGMLRSAHLSHHGENGVDPFALDLSSTRVRAADHVLDGVRAGQQPAALVGYQLERDLVSSRLGRFQLSLRTIAPLVARRLSDRPGTPGSDPIAAQESVAATDVVDGLLLLKQFPPNDASAMQRLRQRLDVPPENVHLPPEGWASVTEDEVRALTAVLARAADTVDAVADVLLAESVLQYAAGNPGRAAAAMDVLGAGGPVADTLDVLGAHDSGRRLTHAALVVVGPDVTTSWDASRPRALAEPRLEAWASAQLGRPHDVLVTTVGAREVTLEQAGLCALDLVFTDAPAALAAVLRGAVPDLADTPLTLDVEGAASAKTPPGRVGLREVVAQAVSLRALVSGAEPVTPANLERPHERLPDEPPARDLGASLDELCGRVEALADGLATAVAGLTGELAGVPEDGVVADQAAADAAVAAAHALDAYGIPLAGPRPDRPLDVGWVRSALQAADARAANARASVARMEERRAAGASPADVLEAAQDVAAGVLGDGFRVLPLLVPGGGSDTFVQAVRDPAFAAPAPSAVRRFVQDHATVRAGLRRWSEARLLGDALGHGRPWTVAQLSETGDAGPAPGTDRWLAGPLPPAGPWPDAPVTHLVLEVHGTLAADQPLAGLVVDGWVEDLPDQPGTQADPQDPQPGRARTGLAVHADAASARPPQALLCAVSPDGSRWTEDSVRAVVESTLSLARARMVTLERLSGQARVLPALYVRHDSLQGSRFLRWATLAEANQTFSAATFVKDA